MLFCSLLEPSQTSGILQELEKLMMPVHLTNENDDLGTPEMVFTREHADLVKEKSG